MLKRGLRGRKISN